MKIKTPPQCKSCYYWRHLNSQTCCCHYLLETGQSRNSDDFSCYKDREGNKRKYLFGRFLKKDAPVH
ncbi:MAG: hypothetical protein AB9835_10300 [Eubacteriales bacterium]